MVIYTDKIDTDEIRKDFIINKIIEIVSKDNDLFVYEVSNLKTTHKGEVKLYPQIELREFDIDFYTREEEYKEHYLIFFDGEWRPYGTRENGAVREKDLREKYN